MTANKKTLGQALSDLLQANGVPGNIVEIHGGPTVLDVEYRDNDNLRLMKTIRLDLNKLVVES